MGEDNYTFGMELEFSDVSRSIVLLPGLSWNTNEKDIVNSDGRAIDPTGKIHDIGGEINSIPTNSIKRQRELFELALKLLPGVTVTHRSHTHFHVSYPGLSIDLVALKKILTYFQKNSEYILNKTFNPTKHPLMDASAWGYAKVDRQCLPEWKYKFCIEAKTLEDFFDSFYKVKDGRVLPQTGRRYSVNLSSAKKHGTIEFRHFYATLDPEVIESTFEYCRDFMTAALNDIPIESLDWDNYKFPTEIEFNLERHNRYQETKSK
jgi:hypothetical protein